MSPIDRAAYRHAMATALDRLATLRALVVEAGFSPSNEDAVRARLTDERFQIAVVGEENRGKTSVVNAILGEARLWVDALPNTTETTWVREGLPWAEVALLDTPPMAGIVPALVASMEAVIFVVMADSPMSQQELSSLEAVVARGVREGLVVVTGMDRIREPQDRARVIARVESQIRGRVPFGVLGVDTRTPTHDTRALRSAVSALVARGDAIRFSRIGEVAAAAAFWLEDWTGRPTPTPDAPRMDALLTGLHAHICTATTRLTALHAAARESATTRCARWPEMARTATRGALERTPIGPNWAAEYPAHTRNVGAACHSAIEKAALALGASLSEATDQAVDAAMTQDEAGLSRLFSAADVVGEWIGGRLGVPMPKAALVREGTDAAAFVARIVPEAEVCAEVLQDREIVSGLDQFARSSSLDRLLALRFTGLQGHWVGLAWPRLDARVTAWTQANPAGDAALAEVDRVFDGMSQQLAALTVAVDTLQAAVADLDARERAAAEVDAARHAAEREVLRTIATTPIV